MSDSVNVLNRASALDTAPTLSAFTGVKLWLDNTNFVFSGNENGRVLEADFPWATQEIADNVLASIVGFEYQPFSAQNALLNPAAELGDGVSVGGVYSVLASCDTNFNAMCASNISAPSDEEIDHEYHYTSPEKRMERRVAGMTSELRVMSDRIEGVVEDVNENNSKITQTVSQLQTAVNGKIDETEAQSLITQTVDKISLEVSSGSGGSSFVLKSDGVAISSQRVDLHVNALNVDGEIRATSVDFDTANISGTLSASYIDSTNLHVNGANIDNLTVTNAMIDTLYASKIIGGSGTYGGYIASGAISDASHVLDNIYARNAAITNATIYGNIQMGYTGSGGSSQLVYISGNGVALGSASPKSWADILSGSGSGGAVFG